MNKVDWYCTKIANMCDGNPYSAGSDFKRQILIDIFLLVQCGDRP